MDSKKRNIIAIAGLGAGILGIEMAAKLRKEYPDHDIIDAKDLTGEQQRGIEIYDEAERYVRRPTPPDLADLKYPGFGKSEGTVIDPKTLDVTVHVVVPPGCKQYFFNENRGYEFRKSEYTVFDTIASSLKNAFKKFDKWKSRQ